MDYRLLSPTGALYVTICQWKINLKVLRFQSALWRSDTALGSKSSLRNPTTRLRFAGAQKSHENFGMRIQ